MAFGVRKHDEDIPKNTAFYACPLCAAVFTKKGDYKKHLKTHFEPE